MKISIQIKTFLAFLFANLLPFQSTVADTATTPLVKPSGEIIPFTSENWAFIGAVNTEDYLGQKTISIGNKKTPFGIAVAKGIEFEDGIIEYDVAFKKARSFGGVQFRTQKDKNFEYFYMRSHQSGNPDANQYMPIYNGVDAWQIFYGEQYSRPTIYKFDEWMHVKIVVSGERADFFIMDMKKPAYTVDLKRKKMTGGLALKGLNLGGKVNFANFSFKSMTSPKIEGTPIAEKLATKGSVLSWLVSTTFDEKSLTGHVLPEDHLTYTQLNSDITGILNLAKSQGISKGNDTAFAKVIVTSESNQVKKLNFGFSEKVKLYLNGKLLYSGSDGYGSRDYRFLGTVGLWSSIYLPLQKGKNEIKFAITEDFKITSGWAIQAQFDNLKGMNIEE